VPAPGPRDRGALAHHDEEETEEVVRMHVTVKVIWTQWRVGIWWWPIRKDLAFGLEVGPLHVIWTREKEDW
jgi:hypothetical protein